MLRSRYKNSEPLEKKVWEIQQDGASLTIRFWARKGMPARISTRELESEAAAVLELKRLGAEREAQGYRLLESVDDRADGGALRAEG